MSITRLPVKEFVSRSANGLVIDVRSPGEYKHACIPGAYSLPLFTDEERAIVGTAYKQQNREQAIKIGLDMFGPKMRRMVEEVEGLLKEQGRTQPGTKSELFVYCWRGGMRSAGVAWLLDLYGYKVYSLAGGYKAFRNYILESFEYPYSFKILGGFTGSGKTEVLQELKRRGEEAVDLEMLACHRGSAFGAFNMPVPPSQEMFENRLGLELMDAGKSHQPIWLEDESQRIGNLNIPGALWKNMRQSPVYFLEIPFEKRLEYITDVYGQCELQKLIDSTQRISKRLGGLDTKNVLLFLEQGNLKEAFRILLRYYDKTYLKGLHNRENLSILLAKINCEDVCRENASLLLSKSISI